MFVTCYHSNRDPNDMRALMAFDTELVSRVWEYEPGILMIEFCDTPKGIMTDSFDDIPDFFKATGLELK